MRRAEEPHERCRRERLAQLADDSADRTLWIIKPIDQKSVDVERKDLGRYVDKATFPHPSIVDAAGLPSSRHWALGLGRRATDQANIPAACLDQMIVQCLDSGRQLDHTLPPPCHARIIANAAVAADGLGNQWGHAFKPLWPWLQLGDADGLVHR